MNDRMTTTSSNHLAEVFSPAQAAVLQAMQNDPVYAWIVQMLDTNYQGAYLHRLDLGHQVVDGSVGVLRSFPVAAHTEDIARALVAQIRLAATQDAEVRASHREVYVIVAHWPTGDGSQHLFAIDGRKARDESLFGPSEPASLEGIAKSQMRHNEVLMKLLTQVHEKFQDTMNSLLERETKRADRLEEGRHRVLELHESLMTATAERELDRKRAENTELRKSQLFEELRNLLPLAKAKAMEHLTGQKIVVNDTNAFTREFLLKLSDDEVKAILATLPASKQALFITTFLEASGQGTGKVKSEEIAAASTMQAAAHTPSDEEKH